MSKYKYTKAELLAVPKRQRDEILKKVRMVYVLPSGRKHDSGWACMDFVACLEGGEMVGFGGGCDDVSYEGKHFRMDCQHSPQIIRIWNSGGKGTFFITEDISSISFVEDIT